MLKQWWKAWREKQSTSSQFTATIPVSGRPPLVWLMGERESMVDITGQVLRQLHEKHGRGLVLISDPDGWENLPSWYGEQDYHVLKEQSELRKGPRRIIEEKGIYVSDMSPDEEECDEAIEMCQELTRVVANMPVAYRHPLPYIVLYGLPPAGISSLGSMCVDLNMPMVCLTEQYYFWRQHEGHAHESMGERFVCHLRADNVEGVVPLAASGIGIKVSIKQ